MYLSRVDMDRSTRIVRQAMADCQKMHSLVMGLFNAKRQDARVLYRVKEGSMTISLYIYSAQPVDRERLLPGMNLGGEKDMTVWLDNMRNDRCLRFDILTMPSKKVSFGGKNSQRRVLRRMDERIDWLSKKAEQNGFFILDVIENGTSSFYGVHKNGAGKMHWDAYRYTGTLQIVDADNFCKAIQNGIGAGKAYGLGMLLLT